MSVILTITMSPPAGTITAELLLRSSTIKFSVASASLSYIKEMEMHCRFPGVLPDAKVSIAGEGPLKSRPSERMSKKYIYIYIFFNDYNSVHMQSCFRSGLIYNYRTAGEER